MRQPNRSHRATSTDVHIQRPILRWIAQRFLLWLLLWIVVLLIRFEGPFPNKLDTHLDRILISERFDFVVWETNALLQKLGQALITPQRYMDDASRQAFVLHYLDLVAEIQRLDREIDRVYTDPNVVDPDAVTAEKRATLTALRQEEDYRQPVVESIIEEQVASVLTSEGFDTLGSPQPPVASHFTPLPLLLVVSPRDRIERIYSLSLRHGLDAAQIEAIEKDLDGSFSISSLVTPIGGLSAYPAMLLESSSLEWITEVSAHEWTHHYLAFRPLGLNYDTSSEARTINETVASIVGKEVGRAVIARYYPELLPPEPEPTPESSVEEPVEIEEQPTFDFRAEMRRTRVEVDRLLAEGLITEAEVYMEERRQKFIANGYWIRKLNQAYFAFHGAYADEPGAAGEDPVGPAVQTYRSISPDLASFVRDLARITTLEELQTLIAQSAMD
ncbi:MAG: hypothetical protein GX620_00525 [Chloroflexi bacterium]|nr:hypothetical protein [Chloroflexota bacterium]